MHNIFDIKQLKQDYYLQLILLYFNILISIFLIIKVISEKDLKLNYIKNFL